MYPHFISVRRCSMITHSVDALIQARRHTLKTRRTLCFRAQRSSTVVLLHLCLLACFAVPTKCRDRKRHRSVKQRPRVSTTGQLVRLRPVAQTTEQSSSSKISTKADVLPKPVTLTSQSDLTNLKRTKTMCLPLRLVSFSPESSSPTSSRMSAADVLRFL